MVLLIYFLFLLFIALPLGEVSRVTLGLTISFTLVDIAVAVGSVVWLGNQLFLKKRPVSFQSKTFILLTVIFVVSLLFNIATLTLPQLLTASLYIVRWIIFGSLFFMVKSLPVVIKKKLSTTLLIAGGLLTLGGYVQYFFYPSLRNLLYFGWDEHFYRMFGTFFDPNFFGLFLTLFFLFILSKMFFMSIQKEKVLFGLLFLLGGATFVAIFLTYSRTALIALVVGILVLFWNKKFWKWLWIFGFAIAITASFVFFLSTRKQDVNSLFRTTSSDARIGSAKNALRIFSENPIFGVGFNAYRYAQYQHHFIIPSPIQEDHGASGADSSLLLVLATSGIIGFLALLLYLWSHVKVLVHSPRVGLATFAALFIGSFFVNGLFYPFLLIWLWIVLGITESGGQ